VKRIKKGDPDEAERAMREHVRFGRKHDRDALKVYLLENTVGGKRRKKE
jgi:DNA-binding FadR family transcriptional regulator